jgi:hypothetical protein
METVKAICGGTCKGITSHNIVAKHDSSGEECDGEIQWWENHQVIQCCGCENLSFRKVHSNTELFDPRTGKLEQSVTLFPEPLGARSLMDGCDHFPSKTYRVYAETMKAVNHSLPLLAAIGLRTLIESVCLDQSVPGGNLQDRINQLATQGLLSQKQADFLHNHRFMGNLAAHEIEAPKPEHLVAALDIAETLLKTIYVLPTLADEIKPKKP